MYFSNLNKNRTMKSINQNNLNPFENMDSSHLIEKNGIKIENLHNNINDLNLDDDSKSLNDYSNDTINDFFFGSRHDTNHCSKDENTICSDYDSNLFLGRKRKNTYSNNDNNSYNNINEYDEVNFTLNSIFNKNKLTKKSSFLNEIEMQNLIKRNIYEKQNEDIESLNEDLVERKNSSVTYTTNKPAMITIVSCSDTLTIKDISSTSPTKANDEESQLKSLLDQHNYLFKDYNQFTRITRRSRKYNVSEYNCKNNYCSIESSNTTDNNDNNNTSNSNNNNIVNIIKDLENYKNYTNDDFLNLSNKEKAHIYRLKKKDYTIKLLTENKIMKLILKKLESKA